MMGRKRFYVLVVFTLLMGFFTLLATGCTHPLTIKNLNTFVNMGMTSLDKPLTIGVIPQTGDIYCDRLVKGVGEALGKYSANVLLPYSKGSRRKVDVLANVKVVPQYEGSGWNFLINWPGFLIFTPAWHGYNYTVNYNVAVALTRTSDNSVISSFDIPINLDIRHAAMNRTWTEISWFEVSAIALIGGVVFIRYDENVSQLVAEKIYGPIGDYIAQEIVSRINNSGGFANIYKFDKNSLIISKG